MSSVTHRAAVAGTTVSATDLARRTIRRPDYVSCNTAFIDCRMPGSETKENYSIIGSGVTQNPDQVINLEEPHNFNVGAAAMPNGVNNNLHLHFTAEVFLNFRGNWRLQWGAGGEHELDFSEGAIVTVPTWIFRGFTNIGADDGWLFTALGWDNTGGIVWAPPIVKVPGSTVSTCRRTTSSSTRGPAAWLMPTPTRSHRCPTTKWPGCGQGRPSRCAPGSSSRTIWCGPGIRFCAANCPAGGHSSPRWSGTACPRTAIRSPPFTTPTTSTSGGCRPRPGRACSHIGTTPPRPSSSTGASGRSP